MSSLRFNAVVSNISQSVAQLGNVVTGRGGDNKYFNSSKKGEIQELKDELHSSNRERKKEAIKKVIAAMTLGKDVSSLFPDVVNCMQTANIELKKLVYLYVINYATAQPQVAILAVNTFRKDAQDANPLIRALAVRTMGCIGLHDVIEYLVQPLLRACRDPDPYVRKTAAMCVSKLHETSPETVEEQGFIPILQDMVANDSSAAVVSNAVAALTEISEETGRDCLALDSNVIYKLFAALGECSEWGQVFILDALVKYEPSNSAAAISVVERVTARLNHVNPAVVLSTIRLILCMLDRVEDAAFVAATHKKLGPPLGLLSPLVKAWEGTLQLPVSNEPLTAKSEVQYVALRSISLIVQKYPGILAHDIKVFFCKFNDAHYVKMEKLEILLRLANDKNIDQVLMELREYASEVDVEFVRRTIRAIGRCAIKLESAAEKCIAVLLNLIETKVNYVVQETIIVVKDIFRKYPSRYEKILTKLCDGLESLDEPEAKASMIWIIGEYSERIENSAELLGMFLDGFHDEMTAVRLQLLTATVKLFLKRPQRGQDLVTRVLKMSTEETDEPDLRDRAFIYWRLLSTDPEKAKKIVLAKKPTIGDPSFSMDPVLLDKLIENLCSLSAIFGRLPETFVTKLRVHKSLVDRPETSTDDDDEGHANASSIKARMRAMGAKQVDKDGSSDFSDLLDIDGTSQENGGSSGNDTDSEASSTADEDDFSDLPPIGKLPASQWSMLLTPDTPGTQGKDGLGIKGYVYRQNINIPRERLCRLVEKIWIHLGLFNKSATALPSNDWAIQINKNPFGLAPENTAITSISALQPGQAAEVDVPLVPNVNMAHVPPTAPLMLQVALKTPFDIFYLRPLPMNMAVLLVERRAVDRSVYKKHWVRMGGQKQMTLIGSLPKQLNASTIRQKLRQKALIATVSTRETDNAIVLEASAVTTNTMLLLFEISVQKNGLGIEANLRADATELLPLMESVLIDALEIQKS